MEGMSTPPIGAKVRLHPDSFVIGEGNFESIADFWGIGQGVVGEVVAIAKPPYQPHPIIRWDICKKRSFQHVSWHPDNLIPHS